MAYDFRNVMSQNNGDLNAAILQHFGAQISDEDKHRLREYIVNWNFWEGFHWEDIPDNGKPQVTNNYVRAFVNKFIAFELGKGFVLNMDPKIEEIEGENNPKKFLDFVWEDNRYLTFCTEMGQSKAITGDAWIQVLFEPKYDANGNRIPTFDDPFDLYNIGRIRVIVIPTSCVFPEYAEGSDKDRLVRLRIMYPVEVEDNGVLGLGFARKKKTVIYTQEWTNETFREIRGQEVIRELPNKYGFIPFVQIKNIPVVGKTRGLSDVADLIPLNMELNIKTSDVSEIIDYHSAPITIVFGARIGQLERGANKVWGGLPKDAKVENLKLEGDLVAANNYIDTLKRAMHEIGGIPVGALGGEIHISNTSGVALQISLMPLLERIQEKQKSTKEGLEKINAMILRIAEIEGLISVPQGVSRRDFFKTIVSFESVLPKDMLIELQQIEQEMAMGIETREGAAERLGKENIPELLRKADEDRKNNPELYGIKTSDPRALGNNADGQTKTTNSGVLNGPEPKK